MTWHGLSPPYGTAVVDPPWRYAITERRARPGYSTMGLDDLAALPIGDLLADDAHVWLWLTNRALAEGWHVGLLEAWGLRAQGAIITWCKTGQPGCGAVVRSNTEHALLAVRGKPGVPSSPAMRSWYQWPREMHGRYAHSTKAPGFLDVVEQVSPGPYVEVFQRAGRLGWDGWGMGYEVSA
jgi:N6-adenosine-specific RNA methylase IME4